MECTVHEPLRNDQYGITTPLCSTHTNTHTHTHTDPSLTLINLIEVLSTAHCGLHVLLGISDSLYDTIVSQFQENPNHVQLFTNCYLRHHPAPSWVHVAASLYNLRDHEVLQTLRDKGYQLKGTHRCQVRGG